MLISIARGLGAVGGSGFAEDISYVVTHRVDADEQYLTNLAVCLAATDQLQYLYLAAGEPSGVLIDY